MKHCILFLLLCGSWLRAQAQGNAFTYQGQLNDGGGPAAGIYDLRFAIYDSANNGSELSTAVTNTAVAVSNGLFTATLDFGAGVFSGADRWLEIGVRTNGGDAFVTLAPRQPITAAPYAITARNVTGVVPSAGLAGTYSSAVTFNNAGNSFTGNGSGLSGVNAATLGGLNANQFWKTGGNAGTTAANFLGTSDNQPLELRVNSQRALRLQPTVVGGASVVGGNNTVDANAPAATIAGGLGNVIQSGGFYSTIGGGRNNFLGNNAQQVVIAGGIENRMGAEANSSAIGGGWQNFMDTLVVHSVIAGGHTNTLGTFVQYGAIGGGEQNSIQARGNYSTIGGGRLNRIQSTNDNAVIAGGGFNTIESGSHYSTISGGAANVVSNNALYAMVPGGYGNFVGGWFGFAAGNQARADHDGAFVWADNQSVPFSSTIANQFSVRASGGVRLVTSGAGLSVDGNVGIGSNLVAQAPVHIVTPGEGIRIQGQLAGVANAAWMTFVDGAGTHLGYVGDGSSADTSTYLASYVGNVILYTPAGAALTATTNGEVLLGPSAQLRATAGEENLRIIRGEVGGNGVVVTGSGFSAVHGPITGVYTITFTTPFAGRPTVTATADPLDGSYAVMFVDTFNAGVTTSSVRLLARSMDTLNYVRTRFHFVAVGPR